MIVDVNSQYIGARYVPKFYVNPDDNSTNWKANVEYEWLTIVTEEGNSYTSKSAVPSGIGKPSENPQYWVKTGDFNASLISLQSQVAKLRNNMYITPENFEGDNDIQKLQACIDYAISHLYPTIVLAKEYNISGGTLKINKGIYKSDDDFYRYRSKLTFIGVNEGGIYKADSGYMFSADSVSGDIAFMNVHFRGGVVLNSTMSAEQVNAARTSGCSVFNCSKLIRITTINCSYSLLGIAFDGKESISPETATQSNRSYGDVMTYCNSFYQVTELWDCVIDNCIIENCNSAIKGYELNSALTLSVTSLKVVNCCIENIDEISAIKFDRTKYSYAIVKNVIIRDNYFESCIDNCIYMTFNNSQGIVIEGNVLNEGGAGYSTYSCIYIYNNQGKTVAINNNTFTTGAYGVECVAPQVANFMCGNHFNQVENVGSLTNSNGYFDGSLKVHRASVKSEAIAGNTTGNVTISDIGDLNVVQAIIVEGIGPDSTYTSHAEPLNASPTNMQIYFRTYGTDTQTYNINYTVIGY